MLRAAPRMVAPADAPSPQSRAGCVYPYATRAEAEAIRSSTLFILFSRMAALCHYCPLSLPPLKWAKANTHPFSKAFKYTILNGRS